MKPLIAALLALGAVYCVLSCVVLAQDPYSIRVESKEVLVPTQVYDKTLMGIMRPEKDVPCTVAEYHKFETLRPDEAYIPMDCHEFGEIRGLTAEDFHAFEDGVEQKIQKVTLVSSNLLTVRDSYYHHRESSGTPAGKWIWPDDTTAPRPGTPEVIASTVSGTLPAGRYSVRTAYFNGALFLYASAPTTVSLREPGSLTVKSPPAANGALTYNVYIGRDVGTETMQGSPIKIGASFVQSSPLKGGADIPGVWELRSRYFYLIAYVPSKPSEGKCHQIKIKVDRRNSFVYYRDQYCYVSHSPSEPLQGTKFGAQMEGYADSGKTGNIPLFLQAGAFYPDTATTRINLALEFPWQSLSVDRSSGYLYATIGILGQVYQRGGARIVQFSDCAYCSAAHHPEGSHNSDTLYGSQHALFDQSEIPAGYQTEISLPPGDYELRVAVSDGARFGLVQIPLSIERYDGKQLFLSSVVLCKRFRNATVAAEESQAANLAPQYVPLVSKGDQFTPTGDTAFRRGDPLFAYFEVYEPLRASGPAMTVQTELKITDVKTGQLEVDTGSRSAADWTEPGKSVIHIAEQIAVDKLPKGSYRLEVQATDSAGKSTAWRSANFTVE